LIPFRLICKIDGIKSGALSMKALTHLLAIAFVTVLFSSPLAAQDEEDYHPFLSDKFNLSLGVFFPTKDITLQVDGSDPDEEIDIDEQFGLSNNQATGSMTFRWRFSEKWSVWGQFWSTDDTGKAVLEQDIEWEDVVFKEGTFAKVGVKSTVARVFFGRKFFDLGPQHEFGAGIGFHWLELDTFIEGDIIIDDDTTGFHRASVDAEMPLPNIGVWYMYSWSPKWLFQARVDWLDASIGDYSGSLWNAQAGVHWQTFEKLGVGLYFNNFKLDVDVDKTDWHGRVENRNYGPYLALTATW
jgi:hypothetical protein